MKRPSLGKIDGKHPLNHPHTKKTGDKPWMSGEGIQNAETTFQKNPIDLSDRAQEIARLCEMVRKTPDIRTQKVEAIKSAMDSGQYAVPSHKVAEKILDEIRKEITGF